MKRYTFLLLAFFLTTGVHASGLISGISSSVSVAPNAVAQNVNSMPDTNTTKNAIPDMQGSKNRPATTNSVPDTSVNSNPTTTNSVPDTRRSRTPTATDIRRSSSRNTSEVGNAVESSVTGARTTNDQLNNTNVVPTRSNTTKTTKTSSNSMSCKTYEGKTYDQGEAGYTDCMRNIRTDRQGTRTVP